MKLPLDRNLWYPKWMQDDVDVEITFTRTLGDILIDDLVIVPMDSFDGTWWIMVGGETPFLLDDVFTGTDTEGGAVVQTHFARAFGMYLPSNNAGGETIADP